MTKIALYILILFSTFTAANAQNVIYSRSDAFDFRSDVYHIVGNCGGRTYTYINNSEGARLDAYSDSMTKVATVLLDFFPERIYQSQFITYPDRIVVLYQALESNKVVQYMALLDAKGLLKGKPIQIANEKTGIFGATRQYYSAAISDNKKHILIYSARNKGKEILFEGTWVNENGNIIKRSKAKFKTDNIAEHGDVNITNDGTVYMAAYTPVGSEAYADQYWLLSLPAGGTTFSSVEMELGEKYATAGYTRVDNVNNRVYFGGFYANSKNGNYNGIIYAAYDIAQNKYEIKRFIPFDKELAMAANARNKGGIFDNYQVRQLIVKNDGGFVLISEEQYTTMRSTFTPGFGYYSFYTPFVNSAVREYHYNDIMALSYDKNGVREWHSFIKKDQYSQEDEGVFSSYALLNSGGTLAFLYNDFDTRRSRIQLATLTPEGLMDSHGLATETIDYPDWLPRYAKQISSKSLLIPCFRKKQICFSKVTF